MRRYISDIIHLIAFILVVGVFFFQTLVSGKLPVPTDTLVGLYHPWRDYYATEFRRGIPFKNFLITDPVRQQIPWRKLAIDQWKSGVFPTWNAFAFSGTSLSGNIQAAVFYPLNVLFFVFSFPVAWSVLIMLQPLGAGLFLYLFLRSRSLDPTAALMGSLSWAFGGFSIAWMTWGTIMHTALWIPLALFAVDKMVEGKRQWWIVVSIASSMMVFAGHLQIALYSLLLVGMYTLIRLRTMPRTIRTLVPGIVLTWIIITAIQWIPFIQTFLSSERVSSSIWQTPGFFLPWVHLVQFIAPDFFGNPATLNYWGTWNWGELVGYIGIVPLLFAGVALVHKAKDTRIWMGTLLVAFLFALPTGISSLPYIFNLPIWSALQPTRLMVLVDLSLSILVAYGVHAFLSEKRIALRAVFVIGGVLAMCWGISQFGITTHGTTDVVQQFVVSRRNLILPSVLWLVGSVFLLVGVRWINMRRIVLCILIGVTVIDLLRFGWKFTPFTPASYFFPTTAVIEFLQKQPQPFRVVSTDARVLATNTASYFGIEMIDGYDPVYSARYARFFAVGNAQNTDIHAPYGVNRMLTTQQVDAAYWPLLNVVFVVTLQELDRPFLTKVFQEGETRVYKHTLARPRIELAQKIEVANEETILMRLLNPDDNTVFVEDALPGVSEVPLEKEERATIESYTPTNMRITAHAAQTRLLVLRTICDGGWEARIDGAVRPMIRVDYLFCGVPVEAGDHSITITRKGLRIIDSMISP
jgi:hypothetical protein